VLLAEFFEFLILLLQDFNNLMLFQCYLLLFILFISSGDLYEELCKKIISPSPSFLQVYMNFRCNH
jgi:hypothetical protein